MHIDERIRLLTWLLLVILASSVASHAQLNTIPRPHDDWQTLETSHFNVHFPPKLLEWATEAAGRMESIHSAVTDVVGYNEIDSPMDIIIMDPMGMTNGMAVPFLGSPRIVLWPNAPVNPLMLGGLETWSEIVMVHEYVHAVHLTRKANSLKGKIIQGIFPLGPLPIYLPAWVIEGYAVLNESKLTGYGRVTSSLRSMVLCQLAVEGQLPEYDELDGSDQWMGGRYPYLAGSAFLEWLVERSGDPECLLKLWKRLSARKSRSFETAFSGVFQDSPEKLYARFRAEITAEGLHLESRMEAGSGIEEGSQWQYVEGMTSEIAVSPDGKSLAVVCRPWKKAPELVVWSIQEEAEIKPDPALQDPDDVASLPVHPASRKELFTLSARDGIQPGGVRWMPDGKSILFHALRRRPDGDLRSDIFQCFIESNQLRRLTNGAALSWVDPSPDGTSAVALKQEFGYSSIVRLDLETGAVDNITEPSIRSVWQNPRVSPDGKTLVSVHRSNNRCEIVFIDLQTAERISFAGSSREVLLQPGWLPDGKGIVFCTDRNGIMNIEKLTVPELERFSISSSVSGLLAPEPARDSEGGIFCLKPHSKGINIHYLLSRNRTPSSNRESGFDFMLPPENVVVPEAFRIQDTGDPKPYKAFKHLEAGWTSGLTQLPYQSTYQVGIRTGDLLGRIHAMLIGGIGINGGSEGLALGLGYRRLPIHFVIKGFHETEKPDDQRLLHGNTLLFPELTTTGMDLTCSWRRYGPTWMIWADGGGAWADCEFPTDEAFDRILTGLSPGAQVMGGRGDFQYGVGGTVSGRTGLTDTKSWTQLDWRIDGYFSWKNTSFRIVSSGGETHGDATVTDMFRIGGVTSSIQSRWLAANRVDVPWLPSGLIAGERFSKLNLEILLGQTAPFVFYFTDLNIRTGDLKDTHRAAGCEWRIDVPDIPMFRLAPANITSGVAYGIDGMIDEKWRGYLTVRILL